jgi:hypothetical protein
VLGRGWFAADLALMSAAWAAAGLAAFGLALLLAPVG